MKTFARIDGDRVAELLHAAELPEMHPSLVWVDVTDLDPAPAEGWAYVNSAFAPPPGPSADELMRTLRAERDRRLAKSDIMVMPDRWETYTADQRAAWAKYRNELRDLPERTDDPAAPQWPAYPQGT